DYAHERLLVVEVLEELADAPLTILGRDRLAPREQSGDERDDAIAVLGALCERRELGSSGREVVGASDTRSLLHDLDEREVRDALAIGQAPAAQDRGLGPRSD